MTNTPNMPTEIFALITGASQGLGSAFARELAKNGKNVLLTALPGEGLENLCTELEKVYKIKARFLECDLTSETEILRLVQWVKSHYALNMLINNAGMGGTVEFEKARGSFINNIILLNVRATAMLTHQLLPLLKGNKPAWILNVSSMACFTPIGYKTVYPASKVFIRHFSRGLSEELKGSGVFVSVVHPGPMRTNRDTTRRINRQGALGRLSLLPVEFIAKRSIEQLLKKNALILVGRMNKINWLLMKMIPGRIGSSLGTRIVKREITSRETEREIQTTDAAPVSAERRPEGHITPYLSARKKSFHSVFTLNHTT